MSAHLDFAVVEDFIRDDLAKTWPTRFGLVGGLYHAFTSTWPTSDWEKYLPVSKRQVAVARVDRVGGSDDGVSSDTAFLDIALVSRDRDFVRNAAEEIRTRYTRYPRLVEHGGRTLVLGKARTVVAPQQVPWSDETMTQVVASYEFRARR